MLTQVAPYAGAWIEIWQSINYNFLGGVAPYAGAWIEIRVEHELVREISCRSLRGSVD